MEEKMKKWYKDAYLVQDACNLSGVVHAFSAILSELWQHPDCTGTDWVNHHPISVAFADKIHSLAGAGNTDRVMDALAECYDKGGMYDGEEDNLPDGSCVEAHI